MPKARKEEELRWLRLAQQKCTAFPGSSPKDNDEKPDFLFPEVDLGIEVTEYIQGQGVRGSPIRRRESIQENLVKEAQKRFEAVSRERLQVSIFWCAETAPQRGEFEYLIRSIVHIVTTLLAQGRECWRPDLRHVYEIKLGKHLGQIWIYRLKQDQSYWSCDEAGAIGDDVNRVRALISKKDARVIEYRKECRFVWFLIVAEKKHLSCAFSPDKDFAQATFRSLFDRVFILDVFSEQVVEIPVSK